MNIEAKELSKIYGSGESRVVALDKVNLEIASSDFISIMGPSGSGKSTLLHLLSGLDKPTSGSLTYDGKDIYRFNDKELSSFRRRRIGFIFQQFNLLPVLTNRLEIWTARAAARLWKCCKAYGKRWGKRLLSSLTTAALQEWQTGNL